MDSTNTTTSFMPTALGDNDTDYISHELRISLTGLVGASYLLEQTPLTEQQKELMNLLHTSVNRLLALANNFV